MWRRVCSSQAALLQKSSSSSSISVSGAAAAAAAVDKGLLLDGIITPVLAAPCRLFATGASVAVLLLL